MTAAAGYALVGLPNSKDDSPKDFSHMNKKKILMWGCFGILLLGILIISQPIKTNKASCGDGICEKNETKSSCPNDCDEVTCREVYAITEIGCIDNGWEKLYVDVDGIERELLWKAPEIWENGAIIALHGGEGVDSNFCFAVPKEHNPLLSDILRGIPVAEFGELAVEEGFAVFSLNSGYNRGIDDNGLPLGKRWDSLSQEHENIDLRFIEKVIDEIIPSKRPINSTNDIFITGISNGGFMTTFAATQFNDKITAFAPVASGDPYGTNFDMSIKHWIERKCGWGEFLDNETQMVIRDVDACVSASYVNEKEWPEVKDEIHFKQFFHEGDAAVHISCMEKTRKYLVEQGYKDAEAFVLEDKDNRRSLEDHFWQYEYNQPLLDFFKNQLWH